jgi:hypothetical protein
VRVWHLGGRGGSAATELRHLGPFARFDHHHAAAVEKGGERAVVYLAESLRGAAAEVFGDLPVAEVCPAWRASLLLPRASCRLVNLRGSGAMRIGARPALGSGGEARALTQEWARAIYEDLGADGIRYTGAHDEGVCLVLFERAPALRLVTDRGRRQEFQLHERALWRRFQAATDALGLPARTIPRGECRRCLAAAPAG